MKSNIRLIQDKVLGSIAGGALGSVDPVEYEWDKGPKAGKDVPTGLNNFLNTQRGAKIAKILLKKGIIST